MTQVTFFQDDGSEYVGPHVRNALYATAGSVQSTVVGDSFRVTKGTGMNVTVAVGTGTVVERPSATQSVMGNSGVPFSHQAYTVAADSTTSLTVGTTGSNTRSDLVVLRVADSAAVQTPYTAGQNAAETIIVQDVPSTTTTLSDVGNFPYPAIALARVDLPAATTDIAGATIVDLRIPAQLRTRTEEHSYLWTAAQTNFASSSLSVLPFANFPTSFTPPPWATTVHVRATLEDVYCSGKTRLLMGIGRGTTPPVTTYDRTLQGSSVFSPSWAETFIFDEAERGKPVPWKVYGRYSTTESGYAVLYTNMTNLLLTLRYEG